MRNNEEFDRLARQKMSEREFAFNEMHWQQAKSMIAAKSSNRRWLHLLWLLLPASVIGVWLFSGQAQPQSASTLVPSASIEAGVASLSAETKVSQESISTIDKSSSELISNTKNQEYNNSTTEKISEVNNVTSNKTNSTTHNQIAETPSKQKSLSKNKNTHSTKQNEVNHLTQALAHLPASALETHSADYHKKAMENGLYVQNAENKSQQTLATVISSQQTSNPANSENPESSFVVKRMNSDVAFITSLEGNFSDKNAALENSRTIPVSKMSLWKISLLGGIWNNTTQFGGLPHADWMDNVTPNKTVGFGAEIMRTYHHFGWGSGVHYNSYSENLNVAAQFANTQESYQYWYLAPVDTSLWVITDSTENGNGYTYIGYSEEHTVNVIQSATGTRDVNTQVRDARKIKNTTSYIEIPLLADIHTGSGPWIVGLRGGPSIGRLIQRGGALPNSEGKGYSALSNTTSMWVPAYNIRAYVDYKLGMNWSVGLQAGRHGIIGNTLNNGPYTRDTNGWGGMVSVSYLLRSTSGKK